MPELPPFHPVTDILTRLDWATLFPGPGPVHIDLGAGDGGFACAFAELNPGFNVLAVERLLGRARKIVRRAHRRQLPNLRVIRLESAYLIRYLVPPRSVAAIHIMHPDPWPKKRQQHRRLLQQDFIQACEDALMVGGELRVVSDHVGYFKEILDRMLARPEFEPFLWVPGPQDPRSDFERHFASEGKVGLRQAWRFTRP